MAKEEAVYISVRVAARLVSRSEGWIRKHVVNTKAIKIYCDNESSRKTKWFKKEDFINWFEERFGTA